MTARQTSKDSYKKITDLGDKQLVVYEALKAIEPASDREIYSHLVELGQEMEMGAINGRRGELMAYGYVVQHGKKFSNETARNVLTWVTADPFADGPATKFQPVDKPPEYKEKFLLKLKNGKTFKISAPMREEIIAAMTTTMGQHGGKINIAGHEFWLSEIVIPIAPYKTESASPKPEKEETKTITLERSGDGWVESSKSSIQLRREKLDSRIQTVGVKTGTVFSDMLSTIDEDGYLIVEKYKE